ncbi:hypothetical protein CONLIGDRAFT_378004 [Coniochaeta ligniaria NRRL 30616]|uniref:Uncharacterized protein n=1 Tax=Coniochaeta ligniaria NRRL 30616 TaxID=1408157 RepID=A0A1J7ILW5_9PEZI|nr:hypothetical protein CONLIGDRAFT_378004 [Coniochaeta ligniaria NRRL 30616]
MENQGHRHQIDLENLDLDHTRYTSNRRSSSADNSTLGKHQRIQQYLHSALCISDGSPRSLVTGQPPAASHHDLASLVRKRPCRLLTLQFTCPFRDTYSPQFYLIFGIEASWKLQLARADVYACIFTSMKSLPLPRVQYIHMFSLPRDQHVTSLDLLIYILLPAQ